MASFVFSVLVTVVITAGVRSETHTIQFDNNCASGSGTPNLVSQNGTVLSTGEPYTVNGEIVDAMAYLQTGACGPNGEGCTTVKTCLINGASSTELELAPPYAFSVTTGFGYHNGCDGAGADCTYAGCAPAFENPDQWFKVECSANNVNLAITFCD